MEAVVSETQERTIPVSFSSFIVSLAQAAMVQLGEIPNPMSGETGVDLTLARHNIDLLGLLETKTKGNLDDEETKLLESVLYDLRMRFVEKQKQ